MTPPLRFWFKRRKLLRQLDEIALAHEKARSELRTASADDLRRLSDDFHFEHSLADDELRRLTTRYVVAEANRLMIPTPEFIADGGDWQESDLTPGHYYLKTPALCALRAAIRAEKKEVRDQWLSWVPAITGLVGALTGLAAILLKK